MSSSVPTPPTTTNCLIPCSNLTPHAWPWRAAGIGVKSDTHSEEDQSYIQIEDNLKIKKKIWRMALYSRNNDVSVLVAIFQRVSSSDKNPIISNGCSTGTVQVHRQCWSRLKSSILKQFCFTRILTPTCYVQALFCVHFVTKLM